MCGRALREDVPRYDTGQRAGIWCMASVDPDGTHDMAYGTGTGRMVMELDRFGG